MAMHDEAKVHKPFKSWLCTHLHTSKTSITPVCEAVPTVSSLLTQRYTLSLHSKNVPMKKPSMFGVLEAVFAHQGQYIPDKRL